MTLFPSDSQQSGDSAGKAVKYKTILEKYIGSAECLKAMAEEILDLPIVEPAVPFGKLPYSRIIESFS